MSPRWLKKRKGWHDDLMKGCHSSHGRRPESFHSYARSWVPKTSLYDRISGKVMHGVNPGPRPYLSNEEEKNLVCTSCSAPKLAVAKHGGTLLPLFKIQSQIKVCYRVHEYPQDGGITSSRETKTCLYDKAMPQDTFEWRQ